VLETARRPNTSHLTPSTFPIPYPLAPIPAYERRAEELEAQATRAHRRVELLGTARLVAFVLAVVCGAWLFSGPSGATVPAIALVVTAGGFLVLVAMHTRERTRERRARELRELNLRGLARVRRDWPGLPLPREIIPVNHPYAGDLDVAGTTASLYRLLDVVSSATGRPVLMRWLLDSPPPAGELRERQAAVRELASGVDLREELALSARHSRETAPEQFESFLRWAEGEPWLAHRKALLWAARVIPILTIASAVLALLGRLPSTAPGLPLVVGLFLIARHRAMMTEHLTSALKHGTGLRPQRRMLELLGAAQFEAPLLQRERERAIGGTAALNALERTLSLLEGQGSLIHAILAAVVLWDVHALAWLDRWRLRYGAALRGALSSLGTVEALAALATLAHDNPEWVFPAIDGPADRLTAAGLAHPLLPGVTRVGNDVTVGPPGTLLLVTGSNMSGKSTLLRAIGLNVVLAQAGAPVCAHRLTMPLVDLRTSIRLADSLERGVSLFMAELERLKEIVVAARDDTRPRRLLYLLDEILHGTNTAERLVAARAVLGHLVRAGAIGAVTTHDLTLAADGALATASVPVHFTEQVTGDGTGPGTMTFDYRLRPGLATSTNALKLLALVGLAPAED
jgi:MutS-like protein